jgi:chloramphenicol-sensitive protein RarD
MLMRTGLWLGVGAYGLWGLFPLFFKQLQHVGSLQVVLHRMVWSMLFVAAVLLVLRRWQWLAGLRQRPKVVGVFATSAVLLACNWLTYIWAVNNGHVLQASLGYFILPLVNVALGFAVLHERPRPQQWLAVALAATAVCWLTWLGGAVPWIALALAVSFALYGLIRKLAPMGALEGMALETFLLAPFALLALSWDLTAQADLDSHTWLLLALCGPVTAIPLLLFSAAARRLPLSTMGMLQYLTPSILLGLGTLLYGEPLTWHKLAGFGLIWLALLVYAHDGWRAARR